MVIGAQLFTVRDFAKDLDGFAETLKRVADIGYKIVQVSGTCDFEAEWLRGELEKNGLSCVLTHTKPAEIIENTKTVCKNHDVFGCKNIGLGAMPGGGKVTDEIYEKFVSDFTLIKDMAYAEIAKEYENVSSVNVSGQFDTEYSMQTFTTKANARSLEEVTVQSNGVHPNIFGYYQIADAVYRHFNNI